jgi:phospholipid transport system transporter-binding protein
VHTGRLPATFALTPTAPGRYALTGRVVLANAAAVLVAGEQAFAAERDVTVDLAGLEHADSGALAVLIEWLRGARSAGRGLHFERLPAQLLAIARLSSADALLLDAAPPAN